MLDGVYVKGEKRYYSQEDFINFLVYKGYAHRDQLPTIKKMRQEGMIFILKQSSPEWERALKYLRRAKMIARESHCYSRQVGAIVVNKNGIDIRTGYNGPSKGFPHCETRHPEGKKECPRRYMAKKEGREFRSGENLHMCPAVHAERNIICLASQTHVSTDETVMYTDGGFSCQDCAKEMVQAGIKKAVFTTFKEYSPIEGTINALDIFYYGRVNLYLFMETGLLEDTGNENKQGV
ncbi:MAG: hypothetical protein US79_C0004G0012 [Parcubacteria group bacterium GW2011_GWC1_38_17]|nr:MAG: hypothetical protein US79_C0004G0012 [Parcubacteria group bacterium GW2011_GWC1_38_17]